MEHTRLPRPRALKAKLTDTRCKSSLARLNMAMKGVYSVLLASKHSARCQRVYEEEILSNTPTLTLTCICYSSMPTHLSAKRMLFQSRPALTQLIMLEFRQNTKEYSVPKTMFQWPISFCIISMFWVGSWTVFITVGIVSPPHRRYNRTAHSLYWQLY